MSTENSQPQINKTGNELRAKYSNKLSKEEIEASRKEFEEKKKRRMARIAEMSDLATDFPNPSSGFDENRF